MEGRSLGAEEYLGLDSLIMTGSGVASYGALGYAPALDSAVLFITCPASVSAACFEMTLYVECTVTVVS